MFDKRSNQLTARAVTARLRHRGRHFHLVEASGERTSTQDSGQLPCFLSPPPASSLPPGVSFVLRPPTVPVKDCRRINEAVHLEWLKGRGASWISGTPELRFCRKHCAFEICVTDMASAQPSSVPSMVTESGLDAALDTLEGAALDECVSRHLTEGGDDRLHLTKEGVNKYYCPPRPLGSSVVIRGSCTCSSPTPDGFEAARKTLYDLWSGKVSFKQSMTDISRRISIALGVSVPHEVILHPSGSDAELVPLIVAVARAQALGCASIVNIVVAAGEVGSGTAPASGGRHFSSFTPLGDDKVVSGTLANGFPTSTSVVEIQPRAECGSRIDDYDRLIINAVKHALAEIGDPYIVLHAVDGSKTGLRVPSRAILNEMIAKLGKRLLLVLDACQCRSEAEELDWFLARGALVLVTASKFYSAPGFCGAVLVPKDAASVLAEYDNVPVGLRDYLTKHEVPESMGALRRRLRDGDKTNVGLLLRWACGIAEMELFAAKGAAVRHAIREWVLGVRKLVLARRPVLDLIDIPYEEEPGNETRLGGVNSVISIKFLSSCGSRHLTASALKRLHKLLTVDASDVLPGYATHAEREAAALKCMVGQPVKLGDHGVLRLAIGAPLAREIVMKGLSGVLRQDDLILDKMVVLAKYCDDIST